MGQAAKQQTNKPTAGAWYLEDAHALKQLLLPHGPFTTRAAAQEVATEIGCGRPVFVPIEADGSVDWAARREAQEPQEMTLKSVLRCEKPADAASAGAAA